MHKKKCLNPWTALTFICIRIFSCRIKKTKKHQTWWKRDCSKIEIAVDKEVWKRQEVVKSPRGQSLKQSHKGTCRQFLESVSQFRVSANIKWKASKNSEKTRNKYSEWCTSELFTLWSCHRHVLRCVLCQSWRGFSSFFLRRLLIQLCFVVFFVGRGCYVELGGEFYGFMPTCSRFFSGSADIITWFTGDSCGNG